MSDRRTFVKQVAALSMAVLPAVKRPQEEAAGDAWRSIDRGDRGRVFDGDGIEQEFVLAVNLSDGRCVRFKHDGKRPILSGAEFAREDAVLKMPVRFVPTHGHDPTREGFGWYGDLNCPRSKYIGVQARFR